MQEAVMYLSHGQAIAYYQGERLGRSQLVLLDAYGVKRSFLWLLAENLAKQYDLLLIDLPGCGKSPYMRSFDSFAQVAYDLCEVLERLEFRDSYILGGFLGSGVAIEVAELLPNAKGCILLGGLGFDGQGLEADAVSFWPGLAMAQLQDGLKELWQLYQEEQQLWRSLWQEELELPMLSRSEAMVQESWVDYQLALMRFYQQGRIASASERLEQMGCPLLVLERAMLENSWPARQKLLFSALGQKVCFVDGHTEGSGIASMISHFVG